MYKLIIASVVPLLLTTACTFHTSSNSDAVGVGTVVYNPGYSNDYVYSVGYYSNRPYWGNNYFSIYNSNIYRDGYWGGGYYNGY